MRYTYWIKRYHLLVYSGAKISAVKAKFNEVRHEGFDFHGPTPGLDKIAWHEGTWAEHRVSWWLVHIVETKSSRAEWWVSRLKIWVWPTRLQLPFIALRAPRKSIFAMQPPPTRGFNWFNYWSSLHYRSDKPYTNVCNWL